MSPELYHWFTDETIEYEAEIFWPDNPLEHVLLDKFASFYKSVVSEKN